MLKILEVPSDHPWNDPRASQPARAVDWVLKRERIAEMRRVDDFMARAQVRADLLMERARGLAREDREMGFRQGVQAGVQAALYPLLTVLGQLQALRQSLCAEAAGRARSAMVDLLGKEPALAALIDTVLDAHLPRTPSAVRICVPASTDVDALKAHCAASGVEADIEPARAHEVFVVSWEGHLWEVRLDGLCGPFRVPDHEPAALSDDAARAMCRDALIEEARRLA